jgi:phage terminase large subunit
MAARGNPNWQPGVSANPAGRKKGSKSGRQLAGLLLEELNAPHWPTDARKAIAHRAVNALMTGWLEFAFKEKKYDHRQKLKPKEWIDLYRFVNTHIDGAAKQEIELSHGGEGDDKPFALPADIIAPSFMDAYRDIVAHTHTEYIFSGGRGSTKSSFVSLAIIYLLKNNPAMHALALRQVADTLRTSVYAQLQWAISELGLDDEFKCTVSPMEIEYLPTGQKIFFRGADDPGKIKSIKPPFGYIAIVWFSELDQFRGAEGIRKIEQSAMRGGDDAFVFKDFNPPPTKSNWANKYLDIPKESQYQHRSNYCGLPWEYLQQYLQDKKDGKNPSLISALEQYAKVAIPREWLGKAWLDEAEHLRNTNLTAYENEYLGLPTNDGGMVFNNVQLRAIADDEIAQFDNILHGLDFGFYPDPASYGRMYYDAARRTLYIFGEVREWKKSNEAMYKILTEYGYNGNDLLIADSAEPKSVMDFKAYGANCRGAEKGPESRKYSYKWLQGLTAIIIDPVRAPYHAEEFTSCEYERTKDGEIISEIPDKNDHSIDDTRYATNLIWRRRGE